jgi:hypothetical protein
MLAIAFFFLTVNPDFYLPLDEFDDKYVRGLKEVLTGTYEFEKLRQVLVSPPLVAVVTGFHEMAGRSRAAGISYHFTKPVEPRVIEDLLRQHALKLEREESPRAARARRAAVTPPE